VPAFIDIVRSTVGSRSLNANKDCLSSLEAGNLVHTGWAAYLKSVCFSDILRREEILKIKKF